MAPAPDVVVIGAGPAGLTAAALLTKHGHRVDVYEPYPWIGGFSGTFETDGFTLNFGAHLLEDPGSGITAIFDHLGLALDHGPTSSDLPVWDAAGGAWSSIRELYAASRQELKKVIRAIVATPWEAFDEWDDRPLRAWLSQHTDDPGVIGLFEYIAFLEFLTTEWWEHSASDSLYLRKLHLGERGTAGYSTWPVGGWARLFDGLAGLVIGGGGRVLTGTDARVVVGDG
ncbi:MAG: NAD(P)/FAD-dependent oxidoreductase, partial [Actinobacteria bacterium]|nr:NAD(P)/FAD-dependent oxidoreductase [Actinomycetota bacterium]NIS31734.1 NAD(P)/FAD-dependent oxidoreductase [Actinomycetota bacterium]NIU19532.1 NAD(P)/FAD-dependent oxidoreductase [Actinomycetota bacterium]NIU66830.1 NAD(P)/FAD-dependent oxidoreductase [Actinomycetota bacterium]NIW28631.1 NAD(P)-binding protein [Actinomycetota bacterium]